MRLDRCVPALATGLALMTSCRDRAPSPASPLANVTSRPAPAEGLDADTDAPVASSVPDVSEAPRWSPQKVTTEGHAMGTHLAFAAFTTPELDPPHVRALFDAATAEITRIEKLMTTWDPASEISRINAAAGKAPIAVGPETYLVISEALHASAISEGAFDITFETLHGLWKFDEDLDPHPPSAAQVRDRLKYVGYRHVKLDPAARTVFLDEAHVRIGLGGIAKGYAVDQASKVLREGGVRCFFVQAGGDLYTEGTKPDGAPWMAGVRDPRGPDGDYFAVMPVSDRAFSTAGDYERSYIVGGKRYHHIIDPHTGFPATASRSVTIWAPTALLADELDDAVFILGKDKGLALIESIDDAGAIIVDSHDQVWISRRLEGKVRSVHPPTDRP